MLAAALPPLRPAAFFCAVVPPCEVVFRRLPEPDALPPRLDAPGEFAIRAARSFDIPFSFSFSYCFSFLTVGLLFGMQGFLRQDACRKPRNVRYVAVRRDALLRRAEEAKRASSRVAFHEQFDPASDDDWWELVVDLAALANTGGGVAVVDGSLDRNALSLRLERQLGTRFEPLDVQPISRNGARMTAIVVDAAGDTPLLVDQQAYFRHAGKSKPATAADLRKFLERRLELVRRQWLRSIREVLIAPRGAHVAVVHTDETDEHGVPTLIRLSSDPNAPLYGKLDPDRTHPYRQTEVIAELNRRLPEGVTVNPYDVLSVRRVHDISEQTRPEFTHVPKFGSPQYSDAFVDWLVAEHERDPEFFARAKAQYTESIRGRRGAGDGSTS